MVEKYLTQAIEILKELTAVTQKDMDNIKVANHSELDDHTKLKDKLLSDFEKTKKSLDEELVNLAKSNPQTDLSSLLNQNIKDKLSELRTALNDLRSINKKYAKSVFLVKDFYDSVLNEILGHQKHNSYTAKSGKFRKI